MSSAGTGVSSVGTLLEQLRGEGDFDSLGHFTLSLEKAVEKIRGMSRQQPARWILFVVQGAVAIGAERVAISFDHQRCVVTIEGGESVQAERIFQAQGAESWFAQAILWGKGLQPSAFDVLYQGSSEGYLLQLADGEGSRSHQPVSERARFQWSLIWPRVDRARTAELTRELQLRLSFCPIPVSLEGLALSQGTFADVEPAGVAAVRLNLARGDEAANLAVCEPSRWPAFSVALHTSSQPFVRSRLSRPFPIVHRLELGGALPAEARLEQRTGAGSGDGWEIGRWEKGGAESVWVIPDFQPARLLQGTRLACRAFFLRARGQAISGASPGAGDNQLFLVQSGVRLNALPIEGLPASGWRVALACADLTTDLTALTPVDNSTVQELRDWARDHILWFHHRVHEVLRRPLG